MKKKVIVTLIICAVIGMIISFSVGRSDPNRTEVTSCEQQVVGPEKIILATDTLI